MAIADDNVLVRNFHGRIGGLIIRVVAGKTGASVVPDYKNRKWSKAQKANRMRFGKGVKYARYVCL